MAGQELQQVVVNGDESVARKADMEAEGHAPGSELEKLDAQTVQQLLAANAKEFMNGVQDIKNSSGRQLRTGKPAQLTATTTFGSRTLKKVVEVTLEWRNLTYAVMAGRGKSKKAKVVLDNVSGAVSTGHMLAIMGPTGCGKTSLLAALAGRLPRRGGDVAGVILVNGAPRSKTYTSISAYVLQDDVLFSGLTVRETFRVAAQLRLPQSMSTAEKNKVVDDIITELGLLKCQDTYIGSPFLRGVSGGERKRTNIGVELLANPSLVYLDEPTSGLDAFQARNVMESLWALAHNGRTVVATIHQPRSSIYAMFDGLLLLSEGQMMYFGPADLAVDYFARWGFGCPPQYNPADFFLDVISLDTRAPQAEAASRERIRLLAAAFRAAPPPAPELAMAGGSQLEGVKEASGFATSWAHQARILLGRAWLQVSRDRLPFMITVVQMIVIGIVLGVVYSNVQKDQKGVNDILGVLFFIAIFNAFGNMFSVLNTFPVEKAIINRERASKSYRVSPYYLAKLLAETPVRVFTSLLFSCIVYWIVGLNPNAGRFFIFVCIIILESMAAQGLGIAVSAVVKNEKVAFAVAPAVTVILILFGGFYINSKSIPVWLRWLEYVSHLYYTFIALTANNFRGACCWTCDTKCTAYDASGNCTSSVEATDGCLRTGEDILRRLNFGSWQSWEGAIGLAGLIVLYNFLGYLGLRFSKPRFKPLAIHPELGRSMSKKLSSKTT